MFAQAFDDLLLLKSGGHVVYHGSLGKRSQRLIDYFQAIPGVPKLQEGLNPGAHAAELGAHVPSLPQPWRMLLHACTFPTANGPA